ncbi:hypothetical protein WA026_015664 [Henosepilachna vigintioctopunctata]
MVQEIRKLCNNISDQSRRVIFRASSQDGPQVKEKYFMDSAHKISFFYEEDSVDNDGQLKVDEEYLALNKIGHALHSLNPVFKKFSFDDRIKNICTALNFQDPVVCQSMFIFKNPIIGGSVRPHKDASYLHTEPQKLIGIWIALEDATMENGCLWFKKGSQKDVLKKRFIRNPDKNSDKFTIYTGEDIEYTIDDFVPVPVKKGCCVVIHGKVTHFSNANTSKFSRNIYTFHVFDEKDTIYSRENWIQPEKYSPFLSLYRN